MKLSKDQKLLALFLGLVLLELTSDVTLGLVPAVGDVGNAGADAIFNLGELGVAALLAKK
ncbi:hypothetical protein [Methanosarcina acetivorans]|uniref:hypothetical protein n=1 Tax=Methanosarcina acetivorans TaxID=2214 RepID=UPI0012FE8437|nr:hypothetical protein [Methanosarcina acetivorans]